MVKNTVVLDNAIESIKSRVWPSDGWYNKTTDGKELNSVIGWIEGIQNAIEYIEENLTS